MSARITTCLMCQHIGDFATFEISGTGVSRMKCPKCGSTSRFATDAAAEQSNDQPASNVTAASAAASDAQPEESDMATEAPTKKRRGKQAETDGEGQIGEQLMLLDVTDPRHKTLIAKLKKWRKIKVDRAEALKESKSAEDEAQSDVLAEMHQLDLSTFQWDGHEFRIEDREKLVMKMAKDSDDESEE